MCQIMENWGRYFGNGWEFFLFAHCADSLSSAGSDQVDSFLFFKNICCS